MLNILILNAWLIFHPLHVTLTSIDQAPGSDSLKVFFRMYYDDFLRDYKLYDPGFTFENAPGNKSIPPDKVLAYFNKRIQIYINHKRLSGKLLSVDIPDNYEICLNLIYKSESNPANFKIRNQILAKFHPDQKNMIFCSIDKNEFAIELTPSNDKGKRKLKN